jgi:signal transduction histidine kinase
MRLSRAWSLVARWAPPIGLGGLALFEIWIERILQPDAFLAPRLVSTAGVLVLVVGLSRRARAPGFCLMAVMAEGVLEWAYSRGGTVGVSGEWFVAMLVSFYSVGAYCALRPAVVRLTAALPIFATLNVIDVIRWHQSIGDKLSVYPFVFSLWAAGVAVRRFRSRTDELQVLVNLLARERDDRARAAVTEERTRIARELHDVVAHSVSTMVLQAAGARQVLRTHATEAEEALCSVEATGRQALQELRRLLGILRTDEEPRLDPQPGVADLELLVRQLKEAGLPVELTVVGQPLLLSPGIDLVAFRIVQEALTNVVKHAGRVKTAVTVSFGSDSLELMVHNDPGAKVATGGDRGHGLIGMRERVALYGGSVRLAPDIDGGYTVQASLPIEAGTPA